MIRFSFSTSATYGGSPVDVTQPRVAGRRTRGTRRGVDGVALGEGGGMPRYSMDSLMSEQHQYGGEQDLDEVGKGRGSIEMDGGVLEDNDYDDEEQEAMMIQQAEEEEEEDERGDCAEPLEVRIQKRKLQIMSQLLQKESAAKIVMILTTRNFVFLIAVSAITGGYYCAPNFLIAALR